MPLIVAQNTDGWMDAAEMLWIHLKILRNSVEADPALQGGRAIAPYCVCQTKHLRRNKTTVQRCTKQV